MFKKGLVLVLALAMVVAMFTGCAAGTSTS